MTGRARVQWWLATIESSVRSVVYDTDQQFTPWFAAAEMLFCAELLAEAIENYANSFVPEFIGARDDESDADDKAFDIAVQSYHACLCDSSKTVNQKADAKRQFISAIRDLRTLKIVDRIRRVRASAT